MHLILSHNISTTVKKEIQSLPTLVLKSKQFLLLLLLCNLNHPIDDTITGQVHAK